MSLSSIQTFQQEEREALLNRRIEELTFLYQSRQTEIVSQLKTVWLSPGERQDLERELRRIRQEIRFLNQLASQWADEAIPETYRNAQAVAVGIILAAGAATLLDADSRNHRSAITTLTEQTKRVLQNANSRILTGAETVIAEANMSLIRDRFAQDSLDDALTAGAQTIGSQIRGGILSGLNQGTIMASNARNQQPSVFADRYARTRMIEVASQATINTSLQYGVDLVQVSYHQHIDRPGDRCPEFAGNTYSITGSSSEYPELVFMPPFHLNCRHVLVPVVDPTIRG